MIHRLLYSFHPLYPVLLHCIISTHLVLWVVMYGIYTSRVALAGTVSWRITQSAFLTSDENPGANYMLVLHRVRALVR